MRDTEVCNKAPGPAAPGQIGATDFSPFLGDVTIQNAFDLGERPLIILKKVIY